MTNEKWKILAELLKMKQRATEQIIYLEGLSDAIHKVIIEIEKNDRT